ncbi:MAG: CvpA family protein [Dehalococcoidia bacterium]|nr:CvpA family protein [Dehalococcoidia bacterium]
MLGSLTYRAYRNGFVRELVSLSAVILAVPLAGVLYDDLYRKVHPIVDSEALAYLISFLAILAGVVVGGQVAAHTLKKTVALLNLGAADRLAGAAFGLAKTALACQVVLLALVAFPRPDARDAIHDSAVARLLLDTAPPALTVLPARFDRAVDAFRHNDTPTGQAAAPDPSATSAR